jgi:hypothetical protein
LQVHWVMILDFLIVIPFIVASCLPCTLHRSNRPFVKCAFGASISFNLQDLQEVPFSKI